MGRQRFRLKKLSHDLRVGGAPDVEQQARVVRLSRRRSIGAEAFGQPQRDKRAVQAVFQGQPGAQISRQTERTDHFGSPDLVLVRLAGARHPSKVLRVTGIPKPSSSADADCRRLRAVAQFRPEGGEQNPSIRS
jgi:hypothetical protein